MQTIYLDISNKGAIPCIQAKQSEVGRKFLAAITDNGVPYNIPNNSLLSVWYEGDTDAGNYSSIEEKSAFSIDGNKVTVELVAQMLLKPGSGELCLSVTHGDGGETNTWNIPYCVEYKPGAGSSVPTEYYTALTEAGAIAAESAAVAKEQAEAAKKQVENAIKNVPDPTDDSNATNKAYVDRGLMDRMPAVESADHPGCYFRTVNGETEWLNPPMEAEKVYRTEKRHKGKVVYAINIPINVPSNTNGWTPYGNYPDISGKITEIVSYTATTGAFPIPARWYEQTTECVIDVKVATNGISTTSKGAATMTATVTIEYTKD